MADKFKEVMAQKSGSWIFTSATLSVNDDLHHFTDRLGIGDAQTLLLPSPFDYAHQALLCVPRNLPLPNQPGAARHLAAMLKPLIEANDGRCFMLCTSHAMMRDLAEQFRATMTLPVLLQGETSKGQLLQQFVSAGNALLVATSSFWEGVDVRGDALSLVIIDKLPFTSPDDPLLKARMEDCRLRGGDPFDEVQPQTGRGASDSRHRRSRGPGYLRQPFGYAPLWRRLPREPSACAAHARYPSGGAFSCGAVGEVIRRKMW